MTQVHIYPHKTGANSPWKCIVGRPSYPTFVICHIYVSPPLLTQSSFDLISNQSFRSIFPPTHIQAIISVKSKVWCVVTCFLSNSVSLSVYLYARTSVVVIILCVHHQASFAIFPGTGKDYLSKLGGTRWPHSGADWVDQEWSESVVMIYSFLDLVPEISCPIYPPLSFLVYWLDAKNIVQDSRFLENGRLSWEKEPWFLNYLIDQRPIPTSFHRPCHSTSPHWTVHAWKINAYCVKLPRIQDILVLAVRVTWSNKKMFHP